MWVKSWWGKKRTRPEHIAGTAILFGSTLPECCAQLFQECFCLSSNSTLESLACVLLVWHYLDDLYSWSFCFLCFLGNLKKKFISCSLFIALPHCLPQICPIQSTSNLFTFNIWPWHLFYWAGWGHPPFSSTLLPSHHLSYLWISLHLYLFAFIFLLL